MKVLIVRHTLENHPKNEILSYIHRTPNDLFGVFLIQIYS